MATNTYVALDTKTIIGSSTSSITFTNIPQGYTDLVIAVNGSNNTGDSEIAIRTGNGSVNTGAIYSTTFLFGNGSTPGSSRTSNRTWADAARTDTTRSTSIIHIMNYSNTTTNKTILARGSNSTLAIATVSLIRDTVAINTVQLAAHYDATFNFADGTTFTIYGIAAIGGDTTPKATGGVVTSDANYYYHTFLGSNTFTPNQTLSCDYLIVAGGGGAGNNGSGGGGAGGYRTATGVSFTAGAYSILVGAGGAGRVASGQGNGASGSLSAIGSTESAGGGFGAFPSAAAGSGGSGGGAGATPGAGNTPSTSPSQGNNGGTRNNSTSSGGGGAGGVGQSASTTAAGAGGIGSFTAISGGATTGYGHLVSGNYYFAGGGGGGGDNDNGVKIGGTGGSGGGGAGGASNVAGTNGLAFTGGGGGGAGNVNPTWVAGGNGGSGIVIIRYAK